MRQKVNGFVNDVAKQNLKKNINFIFVFSIVNNVKNLYITQKLNQNIIYSYLIKKFFFSKFLMDITLYIISNSISLIFNIRIYKHKLICFVD